MSDINTPGWEGLEAQAAEPLPHLATDQAEEDKTVARAFATDEGRALMEWLEATYLAQPSWAPGYDHSYGYFREGQNTLVREIKSRIERAKL
jgi:hypothetical protein